MYGRESDGWFENITWLGFLFALVTVVAVIFFVSTFFTSEEGANRFIWMAFIVVLAGIAGGLLFMRFKRKQARKKFEDAKLDRMLRNLPAEFGPEEDEAAKLAKLYDAKSTYVEKSTDVNDG